MGRYAQNYKKIDFKNYKTMTIQDIKANIAAIDKEISDLQQKRCEWNEELRKAVQAAFEAQHNVKPGDLMETRDGKVFYDGFIIDSWKNILTLCHPVKNDGTASKAIRHISWEDFK